MSEHKLNAEYINEVHSVQIDSLKDIGLTDEEVAAFEGYKGVIGPKLYGYVLKPLGYPHFPHPLRKVAQMLLSLNSDLVIGDKEKFVKEIFSEANKYKDSKERVEGEITYHSVPKKLSQHEDILFNLEVLHFFVLNGINIELPGTVRSRGKQSEFGVRMDGIFFHLEAKKLNRSVLDNKIFGDPVESLLRAKSESNDTVILSDDQQRKIRKQFKEMLKGAKNKFTDYNDDYVVAMDVGWPLSCLGKKINTYINGNEYFTDNDDHFLGVLFKLYHEEKAEFYFHANPNLESNPFTSMMDI